MTTKHTPGPWEFTEDKFLGSRDEGQFVGGNGALVCSFGDSETFYPSSGLPPNEADKRLIAAAPDMLKTLTHCHEWLQGSDPHRAKAVGECIAKALGA